MKFGLNHEGILVPIKESKTKELIATYSKPLIKTTLYGFAFYIGFHFISLYISSAIPGLGLFIHQILDALGFGSYFQHAFANFIQAKSF